MPSKTLSHGELCGEKSESGGIDLWGKKKTLSEPRNRTEGGVTYEELPSRCAEVEYAAVVSWRGNDLRIAQRQELCLCRLARARADACWKLGRDSIVASGKPEVM